MSPAMNSAAVTGYDARFVTDAVGGRSQTAHRTEVPKLTAEVGVAEAEKLAVQGQGGK